jgi:hypothetical protein
MDSPASDEQSDENVDFDFDDQEDARDVVRYREEIERIISRRWSWVKQFAVFLLASLIVILLPIGTFWPELQMFQFLAAVLIGQMGFVLAAAAYWNYTWTPCPRCGRRLFIKGLTYNIFSSECIHCWLPLRKGND